MSNPFGDSSPGIRESANVATLATIKPLVAAATKDSLETRRSVTMGICRRKYAQRGGTGDKRRRRRRRKRRASRVSENSDAMSNERYGVRAVRGARINWPRYG